MHDLQIKEISSPILTSLKESGIFQAAIAQAVVDRVLETAEEMAASAEQVLDEIDFTDEILTAFKQHGFSAGLQARLDDLGAVGEVVSLRMELSLVRLQEKAEKILEVEEETKKVAIEARYELKRNFMLTRMSWFLNVFSLWPVVCLILVFSFGGFAAGVVFVRSQSPSLSIEKCINQ